MLNPLLNFWESKYLGSYLLILTNCWFQFISFFFCFVLFFVFFCLFRATSVAYGGSQSRGRIGAIAACLHHSHSNEGSKPRLRPTVTAHGNGGSLTHWVRPGIKPTSSWILVGFVNHWATMGIPVFFFF